MVLSARHADSVKVGRCSASIATVLAASGHPREPRTILDEFAGVLRLLHSCGVRSLALLLGAMAIVAVACSDDEQDPAGASGGNTGSGGNSGSGGQTVSDPCQGPPPGEGCLGSWICASGQYTCVDDAPPAEYPLQCSFDGGHYPINQTFAANDGCNTCTCAQTGFVTCTARACADAAGMPTESDAGDLVADAGDAAPALDDAASADAGVSTPPDDGGD